jgi:hypothetical protein
MLFRPSKRLSLEDVLKHEWMKRESKNEEAFSEIKSKMDKFSLLMD